MADEAVHEPDPRRWWALSALVMSLLVLGLDLTILNIALPTLAADLHASNGDLQWIADSYALVFAGLLLPAGVLGDRFGRKRFILIGLVVFGVASVLCTWASGPGSLIWARALLGLGAAIVTPLSLSILPEMFPKEERGKAIALWSTGVIIGLPLGPILGGYLLEHFWWGSVFLINIPVIVAGVICGALLLPESRDPARPRVDLVGGLLSTAALCGLLYGVIEGPHKGWENAVILGSLTAGFALLAAFLWWETRVRDALIDLALFRNGTFSVATLLLTVLSFVLYGFLFVTPQYLQIVQGNSAFGTGIRLLPFVAAYMLGAGVSDQLATRLGKRWVMSAGLLLVGAGMVVLAGVSADTGYPHLALTLTVLGLGLGLALPPAVVLVMSVLPPDRTGSGTALTTALRQVGGALGIAVLGSVLASAYGDGVADVSRDLPTVAREQVRDSAAAAEVVADRLGADGEVIRHAAHTALADGIGSLSVVCGVVAFIGAVVVAVLLPKKKASTAAGNVDTSVSVED